MINEIENSLLELRKNKPLILNLTNYVTMDFMANALLALGAAPIMSVCDEELEELVKISNCININLGTLDNDFINRCRNAIKFAKQYNKPVVLDPVGAGASLIRTKTAQEFMQHCDIIRGNASEIISLYESDGKTLGVESIHSIEQAKDKARKIAELYNCTVVVSGAIDYITDGKNEAEINFGSPLMSIVTGMGCTLTAVIAAFRSVSDNSFQVAKVATAFFCLCGNVAALETNNTGTFRITFIDALYKADLKNYY